LGSWDWTNNKNKEVCDFNSHILGVSLFGITDDFFNITPYGSTVPESGFENLFHESFWLLEDSSPFLNSSNIHLLAFTCVKIVFDSFKDLSKSGNCSNDVLGFEVSNDTLDVCFDSINISEAVFDV